MTPIRFSSYTQYRRFTRYWFREVLWYLTGLRVSYIVYPSVYPSEPVRWLTPGWYRDIYTFYHRGRYGWAPRDVWDMSDHLNGVIGHMLRHLAENGVGVPSTYNEHIDERTFREWEADLQTWSRAFLDLQAWKEHGEQEAFENGANWSTILDMEKRKYAAVELALKEMASWWGALWD